jgi:hypothetical protein
MAEHYAYGPRVALAPRYIDAANELSGIDLNVDGDCAFFNIPFKCQVVYAGCIVTTIVASDSAPIKFDKRPTAGSDDDRTDGTLGYVIVPAGNLGKCYYDRVAAGVAAGILSPGDEVVVQVMASSATGKVQPILVVDMLPETMANLTDMVETA